MQNDDKRTSDIGASDARPPDDGLILRIAEGVSESGTDPH